MLEAGGLIRMHYHKYYDVLEEFYDVNNVLYYKSKPLYLNLTISPNDHNYLKALDNGLFVDGAFLDRFSYKDNELLFDNIIVSREYKDEDIQAMVTSLFTPNPFHTLGKLDLNRFFELVSNTNTVLAYKNNSDVDMTITVLNPNRQYLNITIDDEVTSSNIANQTHILPGGKVINIQEINGADLDSITVNLK